MELIHFKLPTKWFQKDFWINYCFFWNCYSIFIISFFFL